MPWRFEDARQRLHWAKAHREAIAEMWNGIATEDLYSVVVNVEDDGTGGIWLTPRYPPKFASSFALELGEFLYQLRSALDSCVYRAAIIDSGGQNPPPDENTLEFPVVESRRKFKDSRSKIRPLAKKRRDIIESVQPYNTPTLPAGDVVFNFNRSLGIIHDWARKDRHRRLHVAGSWSSNASPKINCPPGTRLTRVRAMGSGYLEDNSKVADFSIVGFERGMKIQANPDLCIDIAVKEPPPPCADNDTLGNRLLAMMYTTFQIVRWFEESF